MFLLEVKLIKMIGIICAMEEEISNIILNMQNEKCETISSKKYTLGTFMGKKCVVCLSGIGKVNAAIACQTMILKYSPDVIINTGVAGALSDKIQIGDIVIGENVIQHDFDISAFENRRKGEIPGINSYKIPCNKNLIEKADLSSKKANISSHIGNILTGDQFINSKEKLENLKSTFSGLACEMEGASIGQVCYINKIPFIVIRSISDNSGNSSQNDFKINLEKSCQNVCDFLSKFISTF